MANATQVKISRQDICDSFQELYNRLTEGYWAATTIEDKDRIRGLADAISDILTELNKEDIESRDNDFRALTATVQEIIPRLDKLKDQIDQIIHAVKIANNVAKAIDKALELAGKYFKF